MLAPHQGRSGRNERYLNLLWGIFSSISSRKEAMVGNNDFIQYEEVEIFPINVGYRYIFSQHFFSHLVD